MEKMPYQPKLAPSTSLKADRTVTSAMSTLAETATVSTDWRQQLPVLSGVTLTLRELQLDDAPSLLALLTTEEVSRFISPPPPTVEGFERFYRVDP